MRIPTDPSFPHIGAAFDPVRMRELLQHAYFGAASPRYTIRRCEIDETLYKPGRNCVLVYCLDLFDAETGTAEQHRVSARLCKAGEGAREYERARAAKLFDAGPLPSPLYLADLETVLWAFPNDPAMPGLPAMLDVARLQELLPRRLTGLDLLGANRLCRIESEILHYKVGQTCMIRYRLGVEDRSTGESREITVYGKIYGIGDSAEVFRIMEQVAGADSDLVTAAPLGYDAELKAVWQSHVAGEPLNLRCASREECATALIGIARSVAAFQRCTLDCPRRFELREIRSQLSKTSAVIAGLEPQLRERMAALIESLSGEVAEIDFAAAPVAPLHQDVKLGNFLFEGGRAALIDMDTVCLGDPLVDVASFIASFTSKAIQAGWDDESIAAATEGFLREYGRRVSWPVAVRRLDWYVAASFVYETMHRSFRRWDRDKLRSILRYMAVAERYAYGTAAEHGERA